MFEYLRTIITGSNALIESNKNVSDISYNFVNDTNINTGYVTEYKQNDKNSLYKIKLQTFDKSKNQTVELSEIDAIRIENSFNIQSPKNVQQLLIMSEDNKHIFIIRDTEQEYLKIYKLLTFLKPKEDGTAEKMPMQNYIDSLNTEKDNLLKSTTQPQEFKDKIANVPFENQPIEAIKYLSEKSSTNATLNGLNADVEVWKSLGRYLSFEKNITEIPNDFCFNFIYAVNVKGYKYTCNERDSVDTMTQFGYIILGIFIFLGVMIALFFILGRNKMIRSFSFRHRKSPFTSSSSVAPYE